MSTPVNNAASSDVSSRRRAKKSADATDGEAGVFAAALQSGVEGNPAAMLQLLRRVLRNPPQGLITDPTLMKAVSDVALGSTPPAMPLRARMESVAGQRMARPVGSAALQAPVTSESWSRSVPGRQTAELPEALEVLDTQGAEKPRVSENISIALDQIVVEHAPGFSARAGVPPTRTLLLTGEPGTGKTMAARWIASSLSQSLLTIDLGALMSRELGQSGANLQAAMRTAAQRGAVLLIDELDAVAKARLDSGDVGEARRLVNVFLLELDQWPEGHLLIAATNHPQLLDKAVDRRFERRIAFQAPTADLRRSMISEAFPEWDRADVDLLTEVTDKFTGSDISSMSLRARRASAHANAPFARLEDALNSLERYVELTKTSRNRIIDSLLDGHLSDRAIASIVGVTHPTVGRVRREREISTTR